MITVRQLAQPDGELFYAFRLDGMRESPENFFETVAEFSRRTPASVGEQLGDPSRGFVLGAFDDDRLVGVAGCRRSSQKKGAHRAAVWGMYVLPDQRGRGVARQLLEALIARAKAEGFMVVELQVRLGNDGASRLYQRLGFERWGVQPAEAMVEGRFEDAEHYSLWIGPPR